MVFEAAQSSLSYGNNTTCFHFKSQNISILQKKYSIIARNLITTQFLEKLRLKFGIKLLLLEGGSLINGSFMKAGVIDEISLVQVPLNAEKDDKPLFYEGNIENFKLETVKKLKNGVYCLYKRK